MIELLDTQGFFGVRSGTVLWVRFLGKSGAIWSNSSRFSISTSLVSSLHEICWAFKFVDVRKNLTSKGMMFNQSEKHGRKEKEYIMKPDFVDGQLYIS